MLHEHQAIDARVVQALAQDALRFGQVSAALWTLTGRTIGLGDLEWARRIWGEGGPQLLWEALEAAGALSGEPPQMMPVALAALIARWAAACAPARLDIALPLPSTMVATLPPDFLHSGHADRSLQQALIDVIEQAQSTLILCTPYLDRAGIGYLLEALRTAALRSVAITIITHELHNPHSSNAQAIALLRHELAGTAAQVRCYTAPAVKTADLALRIHAKVLLADARVALIGSANITSAGLGRNLEVGVLVKGEGVTQLHRMLDTLCATQLVTPID
jgi:phosphatidylserine/phosphatidylglycerophosphate/cardiolipin synthase-like enzyme